MHKRISMSQEILRRFVFREISLKNARSKSNRTDNGFLTYAICYPAGLWRLEEANNFFQLYGIQEGKK